MNKINTLFQKMDSFLFKQISMLKEHPQFQEFYASLDDLTDTQRKVFFQSLSYFIVFLPFLFAAWFFLSNANLKNHLETKQEITRLIYRYKNKTIVSSTVTESSLSPSLIKTKQDFLNIIKRSIGTSSDYKVKEFHFTKLSDTLSKARGILIFKGLTTNALAVFLDTISFKHKFKIASMDIKKNIKLNTLNGELDLIHYGPLEPNGKQ